ncbi:MAG: M20 family metallopeptidase [Planctomycetaceae bacterium]
MTTSITPQLVDRVRAAIRSDRLVGTATELIGIPSPTRNAGRVADRLAEILRAEGFPVDRPEAGWADAPAVAARFRAAERGRMLQFNGHLDTVHLPFVPPRVENGMLYGSGASDMKGGIAAALEALRVLRETGLLTRGEILFTAHDLHESPWGDGSQVDCLIDAGYIGDGVLIPEYLSDRLATAGRGLGVLEITVKRDGEPVHEVLGGIDGPNVIRVGSEIVRRFADLDRELAKECHPLAGRESLFVGRVSSGEIYNQSPVTFSLSGTRRWLPRRSVADVERAVRSELDKTVAGSGTTVDCQFHLVRDAFEVDAESPLATAFQSVSTAVMGAPLPIGAKPFVDDGNTFSARGKVTAITHGPAGKGAHTLHEEVPIAELERTALVYALTAIAFC